MIVVCGSCNSRFRLDESRITGRGARVRCRKCGEPITVMKADAAGQGEPGGAEGLDLRSIVREAMEAPATALPQDAEAAGPAGPESERDKMTAGAGTPGDPGTAAPRAADRPAPREPEGREQPPAGGQTVDFGPEEELTFLSPGRKEAPAEERPAPRDPERPERPPAPAAPASPSGFMMSTADSLDYLKADYHQEEQKAALDISGSLRVAPAPAAEQAKAAPPPAAPVVPPPPPPVAPPSESDEIRSKLAALGISRAGDEEKVAAVPPRGKVAAPPPPPPRAAAPRAAPAVRRRPAARGPALKRRQSSQLVRPSVVLLLFLFVALAGGGYYLGFTRDGQIVMRGLVPQITSLWPGGGKPLSGYAIGNVVGYYESSGVAGRMFVIKGQVTNESPLRKSGVRVHAALLDAQNRKMDEKTVYAGNVLAGDVLRKAAREKIEAAMSNPIGRGLANMDIPPGKAVPFMVVFFDAPDGVDSYRLEPRDVE